MIRRSTAVLVTTVVCLIGSAMIPLGAGASPATSSCPNVSGAGGIEGDGGRLVPISEPGADGKGAVIVHGKGRDSVIAPGSDGIPNMNNGAQFGAALETVPFNEDGCTDLMIGVPNLTVNGVPGAGGVQVVLSRPSGFFAGPLYTRASDGVPGDPAAGDHFGAAVATESFNSGDSEDVVLVIGAPGAAVGASAKAAGAVVDSELTVVEDDDFSTSASIDEAAAFVQGSGAPGTPEADAHFGSAVSIGSEGIFASAPDEDVDGVRNAGAVMGLGSGCKVFAAYGSQPNEHFGHTLLVANHGQLWIGAPGKRIAGQHQAGAVDVLARSCNPVSKRWISRASRGVPRAPHAHEHFGAALATTYNAFPPAPMLVAIGAPGTTVKGASKAGAVIVDDVLAKGATTRFAQYSLATVGAPGHPQAGAELGTAVAAIGRLRLSAARTGPCLEAGAPLQTHASTSAVGMVLQICLHGPLHKTSLTSPAVSAIHPPTGQAHGRFGSAIGAVGRI